MKRLTREELEAMTTELDAIDYIKSVIYSRVVSEFIRDIYTLDSPDNSKVLGALFKKYKTYEQYSENFSIEKLEYDGHELDMWCVSEYYFNLYRTIYTLVESL